MGSRDRRLARPIEHKPDPQRLALPERVWHETVGIVCEGEPVFAIQGIEIYPLEDGYLVLIDPKTNFAFLAEIVRKHSSGKREHSMKPAEFKSRLRPLSIYERERMSPSQLQRREAEEERELKDWLEERRRGAMARVGVETTEFRKR